jgi:hypothetical protein
MQTYEQELQTLREMAAEGLNESCGSCGADLEVSESFVWHYAEEDCRGVKLPIEV